jgi:hypothetical protein
MRALQALVFVPLFVSLSGCGVFGSDAKSPRAELFECRVAALKPVCGEVLDAAEVVRDIYKGKADLAVILQTLRASAEEVRATVEALKACDPGVRL